MAIAWDKQENISIEVLDEIYNYHADSIISTNSKCVWFASYFYGANGNTKLTAFILYNKVNKTAYIIYDTNGAIEVNSKEYYKLLSYARKQYYRLQETLFVGVVY